MKIKRYICLFMAALMIFSMNAALVLNSFAYDASWWNQEDLKTNAGAIKSYDTLKTTYGSNELFGDGTSTDTATRWTYIGVEVLESNGEGGWVLTDHKVKPGDTLKVRVYLKTNYHVGSCFMYLMGDSDFFASSDSCSNAASNVSGMTYIDTANYKMSVKNQSASSFATKTWIDKKCFGDYTADWINSKVLQMLAVLQGSSGGSADAQIFDLDAAVYEYTYTVNSTATGYGHLGLDADQFQTASYSNKKGYVKGYNLAGSSNLTQSTTPQYQLSNHLLLLDDAKHVFQIETSTPTATFVVGEGGTEIGPITDSSFKLPTPERTGYTFEYWTIQGDTTQTQYKAGATYSLTSDTTFVAKWKDKVTATFTAEGVTLDPSSITVDKGDTITLPDAQKSGFTFNGWTVSGDQKKYEAGYVYTLNATTEFIADYTADSANNKTATFNTDGGSTVNAISKPAGTEIDLPAAPTKEHYTFDKWKLGNDTYSAGAKYTLNDSVTFTATWTPVTYTAKFDTNGGNNQADMPSAYGTPITLPTPTKTDFKFEYWTIEGEGQYTGSYSLEKDTTFTAKWKDKVTATFSTTGNPVSSQTVDVGTPIKLPNATKDGHTFDGWTVGTSTEKLKAGDDYTLNENTTFTANFTVTPANNKKADFDSDGGTPVSSITEEAGKDIELPKAPTKDHYTFAGWKLDNKTYAAGESYTLNDNVEFKAQWTPVQYTITYVKGNGQQNVEESKAYGSTFDLPKPEWTGHTFAYWTKSSDQTNQYKDGTKQTVTGNVTYTAVWVAKATVSYTVTDGKPINSQTLDVGSTFNLPKAERDNYTFAYWSIDGQSKTYNENDQYKLTGDVTFIANWVAKATVTYDVNGGKDLEQSSETANVGSLITLPNATRDKYNFLGWTLKDVTEEPRAAGTGYVLNADVTFVAQWDEIPANMVTATFNVNGGVAIKNKLIEEGTSFELPEPSRAGYTFDGWKVGTNAQLYLAKANYMINADTTFVAQWTAVKYTLTYKYVEIVDSKEVSIAEDVTDQVATDTELNITSGKPIAGFNYSSNNNEKTVMPPNDYTVTFKYERKEINAKFIVNGKTYTVATKYDSIPVAPTADKLVKYGYVFDKWDKTIEKIGVDEVTYTALWTKGKFTATFKANDGEFEKGITEKSVPEVEFEATIQKPADPTRDYYKFAGWYVEGDENKAIVTDFTMATEGIIYVAKWEQNLDLSYVKSVERTTKPYYETGLATYEITVAGDRTKIKIVELDEKGAELISRTYSKDNLVAADKAGLVKVESLGNDQYKWTINAYLAAGEYKALAKISSTQWETIGYKFTNAYDKQTKEDAQAAGITEVKVSANEVVRGEQLTWTIKTGTDVEWLKFVNGDKATWYKANTDAKTYTVVDNDNVRTWTIPMTFTYSGDANRNSQDWTVEYCKSNSSTFLSTGIKETIVVKKSSDVIANPAEGEEDFCIKSATADVTQTYNERGAITIVTSKDVTKVQIIGADEKKTTFQKEDANVQCVESEGTLVWTINYKFSSKGTSTYKVRVRGNTWGEAKTVGTITVA